MLLEKVDILARIQMGSVNLALVGRGIGQGHQLDGLDDHLHLLNEVASILRRQPPALKRKDKAKSPSSSG